MLRLGPNNVEYDCFGDNDKDSDNYYFYPSEDDNKNIIHLNESNMEEENHLPGNLNLGEPNYLNKHFFFDFQDFNPGKTVNTEPTSVGLLNQKREREKNECDDDNGEDNDDRDWHLKEEKTEKNEEEEEIIPLEEKLEEEKKEEKKKKAKKHIKKRTNNDKQVGRRKKDEIYYEEAGHDKFKEDNIMRKIKTFVFKYILEMLNNSLKDISSRFYPLNTELNENLKKDYNEILLERTIYDIFMNSSLNNRYKLIDEPNKKLIQRLDKDHKQNETKVILNMKYKDVLDHIRIKDLSYFLDKIRTKEKKNKSVFIDDYMKRVKVLLINYENWFKSKLGRHVIKKAKTKKNTQIGQ